MRSPVRFACALALGTLPLCALADTVVTSDGTVIVTPGTATVQAPVPSVAPVAPAYPSYPAYTTAPHGAIVQGVVVVPAAPLTRDDYLREMARRWDASDIAGQR